MKSYYRQQVNVIADVFLITCETVMFPMMNTKQNVASDQIK